MAAAAAGSSSSPCANGRIRPSWNSCSERCCTRAPSLLATRGSARNRSPRPLSVLRKEERLRGHGPPRKLSHAEVPRTQPCQHGTQEPQQRVPEERRRRNRPQSSLHTQAPRVCPAWPRHREGALTRVLCRGSRGGRLGSRARRPALGPCNPTPQEVQVIPLNEKKKREPPTKRAQPPSAQPPRPTHPGRGSRPARHSAGPGSARASASRAATAAPGPGAGSARP